MLKKITKGCLDTQYFSKYFARCFVEECFSGVSEENSLSVSNQKLARF